MNKVILLGRLTKDPELRTTKNNKHVAHFTIAVRRRLAKEGGQNADFLPITVWGAQADFALKYFKKGQQISVVGRGQSNTWQDIEGKRRYSVDIIAEELFFADSKQNRSEDSVEAGIYKDEGVDEELAEI